MGSGNDSGSESNLCPRGHSSPYMVGATACATVPPTNTVLLQISFSFVLKTGLYTDRVPFAFSVLQCKIHRVVKI